METRFGVHNSLLAWMFHWLLNLIPMNPNFLHITTWRILDPFTAYYNDIPY